MAQCFYIWGILAVLCTPVCITHAYEPLRNMSLETNVTLNTSDVIYDVMFDVPTPVIINMFEQTNITINYTIRCHSTNMTYALRIHTLNDDVAFVKNVKKEYSASCGKNSSLLQNTNFTLSGQFNLTVYADLIGRTWLVFETISSNESKAVSFDDTPPEAVVVQKYMIVVIRIWRPLDYVFRTVVYFFVIASTVGMGCKTDLDVVKKVLRKPIAPIIGICCQYVGMPLIAFGVANLIKLDNPAVRLGIFACGICPGGGLSNVYSYLLNGDISLSITMTCISTVAALAMVPLWMFTLGQTFADDKTQISVPFWNIVQTLATVIVPLFLGLLIKYKLKKVASIIIKIIKPVSLVTIIILLSLGIYTNMWIFRLFKPGIVLAGCLLPYIGYLAGGVISLICRQPWYRVKTIAIETGIQNTMIAYLLLQFSLPIPDGDLAAVGPIASAVMTPLPIFLVVVVYLIYRRYKKKHGGISDKEDGGDSEKEHEDGVNGKDKNKNKSKDTSTKKKTFIDGSTEKDDEVGVELLDKIDSV